MLFWLVFCYIKPLPKSMALLGVLVFVFIFVQLFGFLPKKNQRNTPKNPKLCSLHLHFLRFFFQSSPVFSGFSPVFLPPQITSPKRFAAFAQPLRFASLPASNSTAPIISSSSKCGRKPLASLLIVGHSCSEKEKLYRYALWRFLGSCFWKRNSMIF